MSRPRFGFKRFLALVVLIALVVLLLEMNRIFPGVWPGGGSGGLRAQPAGSDPTRLKAPDVPVTWPPPDGVHLTLRGPDGKTPSGWRLVIGNDPPVEAPETGIDLRADSPAFRHGVRLLHESQAYIHSPGPRVATKDWVYAVPQLADWGAPETHVIRTNLFVAGTDKPPPHADGVLLQPEGQLPVPIGVDGNIELTATQTEHVRLVIYPFGRPAVSAPLDAVPDRIDLPEGREVSAHIADSHGERPKGATLSVHYASLPVGTSPAEPVPIDLPVPLDDEDRGSAVVPAQGTATLLAEALDRAPAARRLSPADSGAPVEFVLEPGIFVPVRIVTEDGSPAYEGKVVAAASVEGVQVVREAEADASGVAKVGPFGPGPVEIYAKAHGYRWAAATATASNAMGTVEVKVPKGLELVLVVEGPGGDARPDLLVRLTPEDDRPPDVEPPRAPRWFTDKRGYLRLDGMADRPYTVTLSNPGLPDVTMRNVRPGPTTWFLTFR